MSNDCKYIDDFYEALKATDKYEPIMFQKTTGLFGGTTSSYSVPTSSGFVKVRCESGLNTGKWAFLDVMLIGSIKGNSSSVSSEGSSFFAKSIKPLDTTGFLQIETLTSSATLQLPYPKKK